MYLETFKIFRAKDSSMNLCKFQVGETSRMVKDRNYKEVEIKFRVNDPKIIKEQLGKMGVTAGPEEFQRTVRFDTPRDDLENRGLFLRVREEGKKSTFTVKRKASDDSLYKERDEWETQVGDAKVVVEQMKALGFTKLRIMEKYRQTFILPGVEVVIDRLPFGNFLEIEGSPEAIEDTISRLGLPRKKAMNVSYWELKNEYNKERGLTGENIVFDQKVGESV